MAKKKLLSTEVEETKPPKKKGGGTIGNTNAFKDDRDEVIDKLSRAISHLEKREAISLGDAYMKVKMTYDDALYYAEKYKSDSVVFRLIKKVRALGASVLEQNALTGASNSTFTMFLLKHHYGYSDQPKQQEQSHNITIKWTGKNGD